MWACLNWTQCLSTWAAAVVLTAGANHPGTSLNYPAPGLGWVEVWGSWGSLLKSPSVVSSWDRLLTSLQPAFQGTPTEAVSLSLTPSQESYSITSVARFGYLQVMRTGQYSTGEGCISTYLLKGELAKSHCKRAHARRGSVVTTFGK